MEIVEVKCSNCNKDICIDKSYIREKMFCTLLCMDQYSIENMIEKRRKNEEYRNYRKRYCWICYW